MQFLKLGICLYKCRLHGCFTQVQLGLRHMHIPCLHMYPSYYPCWMQGTQNTYTLQHLQFMLHTSSNVSKHYVNVSWHQGVGSRSKQERAGGCGEQGEGRDYRIHLATWKPCMGNKIGMAGKKQHWTHLCTFPTEGHRKHTRPLTWSAYHP